MYTVGAQHAGQHGADDPWTVSRVPERVRHRQNAGTQAGLHQVYPRFEVPAPHDGCNYGDAGIGGEPGVSILYSRSRISDGDASSGRSSHGRLRRVIVGTVAARRVDDGRAFVPASHFEASRLRVTRKNDVTLFTYSANVLTGRRRSPPQKKRTHRAVVGGGLDPCWGISRLRVLIWSRKAIPYMNHRRSVCIDKESI